MNLVTEGEKLLARRLTGERLSRRERRELDFWVQWRINLELEHICMHDTGNVQDLHSDEFEREREYEAKRQDAFDDLVNAVEEE